MLALFLKRTTKRHSIRIAKYMSQFCSDAASHSDNVPALYSSKLIGPWKYEMTKEQGNGNEPGKLYGTMFQLAALTVDNVILTKSQNGLFYVLRTKRGPKTLPAEFANTWAIPGGFLDYGKETLHAAAMRETQEETGITGLNPKEVFTVSDPDRDPRQHTVSVIYATVVDPQFINLMESFVPADKEEVTDVKWIPVNNDNYEYPFDHKEIVDRVVQMVKDRPDDFPVHPFCQNINVPRQLRKLQS